MKNPPSLQETIAKGKRHYYNGLTFRNWKGNMLKTYGGDARPFLDDAWNAITGEAEAISRENRSKQNIPTPHPATHRKQQSPINLLGDVVMLILNVIACVALLVACVYKPPYSFYTNLRWVCFVAFTFGALWRRKDGVWILWLPLAWCFNPIYPIHLARNVWSILDLAALALTVATSLYFVGHPKK
jgi:hypothetical protein